MSSDGIRLVEMVADPSLSGPLLASLLHRPSFPTFPRISGTS